MLWKMSETPGLTTEPCFQLDGTNYQCLIFVEEEATCRPTYLCRWVGQTVFERFLPAIGLYFPCNICLHWIQEIRLICGFLIGF